MAAFKLNPETLTSVEAIAAVLDGLGLVIRDDAPMFDALSAYFNIEVPAANAPAEALGQETEEQVSGADPADR
jgi:hypothetical protein